MEMKPLNVSRKREVKLPQFSAVLSGDIAEIKPILVVLGGRVPDADWLAAVAKNSDEVWAADSGGSACLKAKIIPARLIGDFDSILESDKAHLISHGTIIEQHPKDKDLTDYQLCLKSAAACGKKNVIVTGAWGGRFDHEQSNIYSALWAREWGVRVLCLADEREAIFYLGNREHIEISFSDQSKIVSLLALDMCENVNVNGTQWELNAERLVPNHPYSLSNKPLADKIKVSLRKGSLGVYVADAQQQS